MCGKAASVWFATPTATNRPSGRMSYGACALLPHDRYDCLAALPHAFDVDCHHLIPLGFLYLTERA
jgi:hypothetical protein